MDAHAVHAALTANGHALAATLESMNIDADAMVFLILPTSANLAAAVDDETGTGALVFAISPALVTPDIGTPSDGTLTNCDGLPAAGVVGTALVLAAIGTTVQAFSANLSEYAAVNPTAAGLALLDDADAAAQRVTLGLVIGTNVQAYDADLATWAGVTPGTGIAAALAVAVGSAGAPVVNGGALGTPTSGDLSSCTADGTNSVGFRHIPQNSKSAAYTTVLADAGKHILHPSADTTARTMTIDSNANVAYPVGTALTFVNQASAGVMTIAITADTMRLAGAGTTGSRTLAANGIATALKLTSTEWIISGTGLT